MTIIAPNIADIASFQNLFSEDIIEEAELKEKEVENAETKFRKNIKQAMDSVRSGNKGSEIIDEILSEFLSTENSSLGIKSFLRKKEISLNKIKQFRALTNYGVETLTEGLDKFSLNKIYVNKSVFILFFSDEENKLCDLNEFKEIIQHTILQGNCFREHEDMVLFSF